MKSGDVFSFEAAGAPAFIRAVLPIRSLGLPAHHPLAFASGTWLIQVSRSVALQGAFSPQNLLLDGVFLLRHGTLLRSGFTFQGSHPLAIHELDFPWFLAQHDQRGFFACWGELTQRLFIGQDEFEAWDVRVTLSFPASVRGTVERYRARYGLHSSELLTESRTGSLRHYQNRGAVVERLGLTLSGSYIGAVSDAKTADRAAIYERLLLPRKVDRRPRGATRVKNRSA